MLSLYSQKVVNLTLKAWIACHAATPWVERYAACAYRTKGPTLVRPISFVMNSLMARQLQRSKRVFLPSSMSPYFSHKPLRSSSENLKGRPPMYSLIEGIFLQVFERAFRIPLATPRLPRWRKARGRTINSACVLKQLKQRAQGFEGARSEHEISLDLLHMFLWLLLVAVVAITLLSGQLKSQSEITDFLNESKVIRPQGME